MTFVRAYVGVTDPEWYRFLRARPELLEEVNFWRPGEQAFHALLTGEPFFFKTRSPQNKVVGGGIFSKYEKLPISHAWELFKEANGVETREQLRAAISRNKHESISFAEDPDIGCLFIRDVVFFPEDMIMAAPPGFAPSIMQGKRYDLADRAVAPYFDELMLRLLGMRAEIDTSEPWHRSGPVFGDPRLAPYRLGQRSFQAVVLNAYHRRCAISGTHIAPVLQAAHIQPVTRGGEHRLDNGLLLRSDVHTLFDHGYLSIDPGYRLVVSPSRSFQ